MERKIGEIFEFGGEWYQCIEGKTICSECDLRNIICQRDTNINNPFKGCSGNYRTDKRTVIYKKLEKIGEPYEFDGHIFQSYRTFEVPIFTENYATVRELGNNSKISIEIKQIKEDMGDLDKIKVRDYTKVEELNVMEEKKLNLKPFDIQKAREGKPVCTRDGRKARIICFDAKDTQPIIGLYEKNIDGIVREYLCSYHTDGRMYDDQDTGYDLMMPPEKKEGWVNVYYDRIDGITFSKHPYPSKEEAIKNVSTMSNRIDTVKISWEE